MSNEVRQPFGDIHDPAWSSGPGSMIGLLKRIALLLAAGFTIADTSKVHIWDGTDELLITASGEALVKVNSALPTGTNNIGDVDVLTVPGDPFGANADASSATGSISAKLRFLAAGIAGATSLPAGANNIGDVDILSIAAGDNNIGDVDVLTVNGFPAHDAPIAGNPLRLAGRAITADYTAVATGDTADLISTILGKQIVKLDSLPDLTWLYAAPAGGLVNTTAVTVKAAGAAGVRNYVKSIQVINSHATISTEIMVRDGAAGPVLHRGWAQAAGGGYACNFDPPLRGSVATLLEIVEVSATATAGVLVSLQGYSGAE